MAPFSAAPPVWQAHPYALHRRSWDLV